MLLTFSFILPLCLWQLYGMKMCVNRKEDSSFAERAPTTVPYPVKVNNSYSAVAKSLHVFRRQEVRRIKNSFYL